ncbi:chalcone isomerase family protein [Sulfurospirillum sp. 1612]|uniref:chalcone isomerase family protein n=1 Tax=Sulfurospirillum sp. 1612 TaxID=3094835 RepID=UPI002F9513E8
MRYFIIGIIGISFCFFTALDAKEISGIKIPNTIQNPALQLNGAGIRNKFFFDLYVGALYVQHKTHDAHAIIDANNTMEMTLHITSSLISTDKMVSATLEGFENATQGNITPLKKDINTFLHVFHEKIRNGDIYRFLYEPKTGVHIYKNQKLATIIKGLAFKKALFGIWFCDKPAQQSLKQAMLGL